MRKIGPTRMVLVLLVCTVAFMSTSCALLMGDVCSLAGRRHFDNGAYQRAIRAYTASLNWGRLSLLYGGGGRPTSLTLNLRGEAHLAMGNYSAAIADFIAALSFYPANETANENLARAMNP